MSSSNKRIKETPIDRLSALPDTLIIHILSLLDVNQSAITAVLAKRWRNFWRESPRLVFIEKSRLPENTRDFVARVNRILLVISGGRNDLETFEVEFYYKNIYSLDVDVWFDFAIRNKVKQVSVLLNSTRPSILDSYSLPQMMFHNSNLKRLILRGCVLAPRGTIEWRSLTELRIGRVELQQHVIENILSGCPVLCFLWLIYCWGFSRLKVESKCLYKLSVCDRENELNHNEPLLRISAPYVRKLWVSLNPEGRKLSLGNTSSLVKATIDFIGSGWNIDSEEMMDNAKELLEKIRHVKTVTMRGCCIEVLSSLAMTGYQFPQSARTRLSVNAPTENGSIDGILGLLESSPNLEALVIEGSFFLEEPAICEDPKGDMNCDLLHLKTITFKKFVHPDLDGEPMLTLARILLNKAPALSKMVVNIKGIALSEPFKIAQTLLSYPRSSMKAVILLN
ncbi:putative F-box/LRR-repeat protein at5g02700 [Phtheirospermum japonicum]|uniref:Putative F-box/LRR-repeat protein at5g02700 n=1 Tax=Phtheirospermum japonicum TaxID=374723 RepID=A0A830BD28_9LAMI|nr:putative F-box/LRR-repeat protein at5g02700 [Phtheirospermum japonicum]